MFLVKFLRLALLLLWFHSCFLIVKVASLFVTARSKKSGKRILYLCPFSPASAGDIYRAEKWAKILREEGFRVDVKYIFSQKQYDKYSAGDDVRFYLIVLLKRIWQVLTSYKYNVVIVRRELLLYIDYGNLFMEKLLLKMHPNAILDFDDASSYEKGEPREITSLFGRLMLENGARFTTSLTLYKNFFAAGDYLKEYLQSINKKVEENNICVMPMYVDYENYPRKNYKNVSGRPIILGWLGTSHNLISLENILADINQAHKTNPVKLIVISGTEFKAAVEFEIENILWSYETQIEDMLKMDIGLMPLKDTFATYSKDGSRVITKGKGAFKLLQYMGLGIVSIADDTVIDRMRFLDKVNIVDDNIDGFLIKPGETWAEVITKAVNSSERFDQMGRLAQKKIHENYSYLANKERYIAFINRFTD